MKQASEKHDPTMRFDDVDELRLRWLRDQGLITSAQSRGLDRQGLLDLIADLHASDRIGDAARTILTTLDAQSSLIGPFATTRIIGEGAMGRVYLARHIERGTLAALKSIRVDKATIERLRKRFKHEVALLYRINHPMIARLYAWDLLAEPPWLAMEYVGGISLDQYTRIHGPLPEALALSVVEQVPEALDCVREQVGLVHRDLKPGNIMLQTSDPDLPLAEDDEPVLKLIDFGLAKDLEAGSALTADGSSVGTPAYMSREQIEDSATVDHRADIYGLGATCFHLLTGRPPFAGRTPLAVLQERLKCPLPDVGDVRNDLHPQTRELIRMAMAETPERRYQSHKALARACRLILEDVFGRRRISEPGGLKASTPLPRRPSQALQHHSGAMLRRAPGKPGHIHGEGSSALRQLLVNHDGRSPGQRPPSGRRPIAILSSSLGPLLALALSILLLLLVLSRF